MTFLIPTCERVVSLLTAYEDGALGPLDWFGIKLHLALCPPCQTFLEAFQRTPALLRRVWAPEPPAAAGPTPAEQALASVLAALREGRIPKGPQLHPEPRAWASLGSGGDPLKSILLRMHLGHCEACRGTQGGDQAILPSKDPLEALRPHLPPETQWRWIKRGLGGGRVAVIQENTATGASLNLACLPGGRSTPVHHHLGLECALVLCGALQDGPAHLRAGDWIAHDPGTLHGPTADPGSDCWALISLERPVQFTGWRGAIRLLG
jgi:anti-sigma factor ChrR (cupin superfamily)